MKALITGAGGQLGYDLQQTKPNFCDIIALSHEKLDICDSAAVNSAFAEHQPDVVINAAAYTAVDKAEQEKDTAYAVNAKGAANMAKAAVNSAARLIHISTDFVFDGRKSTPYLPGDTPNPLNIYGASKLQGELNVTDITNNNALIIRTSWVYSVHGFNFVKTMLKLMAERDEINVVSDQIGTPTWARNIAEAIWTFTRKPQESGIFHYANEGTANWYDFAVAIRETAFKIGLTDKEITINPIETAEYPTPAKRPSYCVLDCTSSWKSLGSTAPHWRDSLKMMLTELKGKNNA